ncbi:T9SS C-terminal target domain-containing protein [Chryseobacterium bernardetii]|uniref:T9SS C-terminal target domain-containing protein n=1 Tax=Chryseobacterium bernardetii TaxID=1241978 RepID=A0A3G6T810_9FLAO|nr:T9SS type A sorting domain-containing protein [Chryseobacterium bernardetii]AZB25435.1 T9SS C-terminal target domain-containing protein [Chryseobacterium bernardetii]
MKNRIYILIINTLCLISFNMLYCGSYVFIEEKPLLKTAFTCGGSESFENIPIGSGSFETNTWINNNITWTASDSRTDQSINGKAITIRNGNLMSSTINGGIKSLTMTTQLKFAGNSGELMVEINDIPVGTIPFSSIATVTTIDNLNVTGDFVIKILNPNTGQRIAIDDLSWTCYSSLGVNESTKSGQLPIYPNPIKNGEYLNLNEKVNEILIYNIEGRLIKKSNLKSNSILINDLLKGMYFLKTENTTHKFIVN